MPTDPELHRPRTIGAIDGVPADYREVGGCSESPCGALAAVEGQPNWVEMPRACQRRSSAKRIFNLFVFRSHQPRKNLQDVRLLSDAPFGHVQEFITPRSCF